MLLRGLSVFIRAMCAPAADSFFKLDAPPADSPDAAKTVKSENSSFYWRQENNLFECKLANLFSLHNAISFFLKKKKCGYNMNLTGVKPTKYSD